MEKKETRFLTEKQAAAVIGISPMSLFHLRRCPPDAKRPIPFIRLGTRIRYEEKRLLDWIRAHEVKGGDSAQAGRRALRRGKDPTAPRNKGGRPPKGAEAAVKRGRPPKAAAVAPPSPPAPAAAVKRGPGRPPKAVAPVIEMAPKRRGPGRPKKLDQAMAASVLKKKKKV